MQGINQEAQATLAELAQRARAITTNVESRCQELTCIADREDLPRPPQVLSQILSESRQEFVYLVLGETKRGKTSLINALLGAIILPVDTSVATSQVVRIKRASTIACRLRFLDGSSRDIRIEEIPKYGSKQVEDVLEADELNKVLKWIELDYPAKFLPEGVVLLDTPGLGAVHEAHKQITHRFVPEADAVIFVLDSTQPITQPELDILARVAECTTNLVFVQTKTDIESEAKVAQIINRSETLIRERLGAKLANVEIHPISNKMLADAEGELEAAYVEASHFENFDLVIQAFMQGVLEQDKAQKLMGGVTGWWRDVNLVLVQRSQSSQAPSAENVEAANRLASKLAEFERQWGPMGAQRAEAARNVAKAILVAKTEFNQFISYGGGLERMHQDLISSVSSSAELERLGQQIGDMIVNAADDKWREVSGITERRCSDYLSDLLNESDGLALDFPEIGTAYAVSGTAPKPMDFMEKVTRGRGTFMTTSTLGGAGAMVIGALFPPLGLVAGVIAGIWSIVKTVTHTNKASTEDYRNRLRAHVRDQVGAVRTFYTEANTYSGCAGIINDYFEALADGMKESVESFYQKRSGEVKTEIALVRKNAEKNAQEQKATQERVKAVHSHWVSVGQELQKDQAQMVEVSKGYVALQKAKRLSK